MESHTFDSKMISENDILDKLKGSDIKVSHKLESDNNYSNSNSNEKNSNFNFGTNNKNSNSNYDSNNDINVKCRIK